MPSVCHREQSYAVVPDSFAKLDGVSRALCRVSRGRTTIGEVAINPNLERELRSLLDYPSESAATEIKDWLDLASRAERANVARELIALANHGGGNLLFGFTETTGGWEASGECAHDLARYSQDEVNNILKAHAGAGFRVLDLPRQQQRRHATCRRGRARWPPRPDSFPRCPSGLTPRRPLLLHPATRTGERPT
jgi:hypothetical protein